MTRRIFTALSFTLLFLSMAGAVRSEALPDTLPALKNGQSPQTVDEVWAGFDPTKDPIEAKIYKEWQEEQTVIRAVRYCIGTFKGQKAWMGALYGFPIGHKGLPGIVQIHGGGGKASKEAVINYARRGYATISLNWRADDRYLTMFDLPPEAQTDWGAVEGRQVAESRGIESNNDKRLDPVPSARNGGYFLRVLAARRALTFLQQQAEVDAKKLGIDGHSMGGVITLEASAMDDRVKASAPSCAPPIETDDSLKARTYSASAYASKITCPMLFMSPSNDFHGHVEDMEWIMDRMPNQTFRIARSEHFNHKHNASCLAAKELWFDALLKNNFTYPARPEIEVQLNTDDHRPHVRIVPDRSQVIDHVDVFFTRDAKLSSYNGSKSRYWQFATVQADGDAYVAAIDLFDTSEPLWVSANVHYKIADHQLTTPSDTMTCTSRMVMVDADALTAAGIKGDNKTTKVIEDFDENWQKEWIVNDKSCESFVLSQPRVSMAPKSKLVIGVADPDVASIRVALMDYSQSGDFAATVKVKQGVASLYPFELKNSKTGNCLLAWDDLSNPRISLRSTQGILPKFTTLKWENVPKSEYNAARPFQLADADGKDGIVDVTFATADKIEGRYDTDLSKFQPAKGAETQAYKRGLNVHSLSELTYFLNSGFAKFQATLVPGYQASVTFEIYGDGKLIYQSQKFTGATSPEEIIVDVTGIQTMKLVVTEGGNGWGGDWALWASPRLTANNL